MIQVWGRWYATKISKQIQLDVRRRVFEHAVRLPLHRVQEIRSGGVASILREDGGSVGELMFGMVFNPWRAIIQLVGSARDFGLGRLDVAARGAGASADGVSDPSRLDQQHPAAIPRDSQTAGADRRGRHGIVRRNADRPRLQPAEARGGSVYDGKQPDGPPGTVRLVVDARRRNGLGSSDSRRQRRTAVLRRNARARGSHDRGRSDDVSGLSVDAAGTARHARIERDSISKQPERARSGARSVGRIARDAVDSRLGESGSPFDRRAYCDRARVVYLSRRRPARPERRLPLGCRGADDRLGRTQRRGQNDAQQSGGPLL